MMDPAGINWELAGAILLGYGMLAAAYASGVRIRRLGRLENRRATDRPLPEPLQWHMLTGFAAGGILTLASLVTISRSAEIGLTVPALAAVSLIVLSGAARVFLGGRGRLHLAAVIIGAPVFLAALAVGAGLPGAW